MSINACSINEHTINALCGRRRQAIIDTLLPPIPQPATKGHPQKVNPDTTVSLDIFRREQREEVDYTTLELPYISVTVEMSGVQQTQTLERDEIVPMVTVFAVKSERIAGTEVEVTEVKVSEKDDTTVNITDVNIRVI